jgi:uncharacterized protein (DUF302 family)
MLPVDPTVIEPDDIGEKRAVLEMEHEQAVEHVREAFEEAGFGIPVEFSPADLLNEKLDKPPDETREPYYVLGACNPSVADKALEVTEDIGGLFPCNVIVRQLEPGRQEVYHVSIMRIARLVGIAPDDDRWADIIAETGTYVEEAYDNL